ncbi:DUF6882 domain-containing protein [Pseudomonas sp. Irchel 3A5]|uniref:DUF6882 domain-containing protein n=1 Tax=Pseudomonas sp. Irchel 3A5 TaxID=2008911 RepID=UPI000BA4631A|nr:DUF6882 domain-containing protein [Pseudomonas sp. Irchel 3A5]
MEDNEFALLLEKAMQNLMTKQEALQENFGLGEMARWWMDQTNATVQFFDENDRLAVEANILNIGSFAPKSDTWKWAWCNPSVEPELRDKALPLKNLRDITGIELFGSEEAFAVEGESMAWELAAIAVHYLNAEGCYRAPTGEEGPNVYLALTNVKHVRHD